MRSFIKSICQCAVVFFVSTSALAATITVDDDGPADYTNIQAAIDAAYDGDTIIVSPGTYYENIVFDPNIINNNNLVLTSTDPTDPNIVAATIIRRTQNGPVVTFYENQTTDTRLSGFTITNGNASRGGGICGNNTHATITHCIITDNTAKDYGGGLYRCDGLITNCTITGNTATWYGGGLFDCDGTITNCTITDNTGPFYGGGLYNCHGTISNCTITSNTANDYGGGLYLCDGTITNCTISGNTARYGGGLYNCHGTISNCTITSNTANDYGGGLLNFHGPITNCIVWGNSAVNQGDQIHNSSRPSYTCIQDWTGGGTGNITSDPLFADAPNDDYHLKSEYGRWYPNSIQWVHDDMTSPCIDAGAPYDVTPSDPNDWQNELWPHGGRINMGAYGGTPQASMSPNPIGNIADLDHDNGVDTIDLMLFCEDYLREQYLLDTDLNLDGGVDMADFALFASQWLWVEP